LIYGNKPKEPATRGHYHVSIIKNTRVKNISGHLEGTAYAERESVFARGVSEGVQAMVLISMATVLFS
jgi:hypothetical protein